MRIIDKNEARRVASLVNSDLISETLSEIYKEIGKQSGLGRYHLTLKTSYINPDVSKELTRQGFVVRNGPTLDIVVDWSYED